MSDQRIVKYGTSVLREVAEPVDEITDEVRQLASKMLEILYKAEGVGLAAPQIGISKRIVVIDISPNNPTAKPMVLINPEIIKSEGQAEAEEGCLSVPEIRGGVKRAEKVTVEALDLNGNKISIEAQELLARVLQHEIDHLNGKFFVDHLSRLKQQLIRKQLRKIEMEAQKGED